VLSVKARGKERGQAKAAEIAAVRSLRGNLLSLGAVSFPATAVVRKEVWKELGATWSLNISVNCN